MMALACESLLLSTRYVLDFFGIKDLDKEFYEQWHNYADLWECG